MQIPITEGLLCPACEQHTRRAWQQPQPGGPIGQTDCLNPDCDAYYITLETSAFFALFGQLSKEKEQDGRF